MTAKKICCKCKLPKFIWKNFEGNKYCKECWFRTKPTSKPKTTKSIPRVSEKRSKEERIYSAKRLIFLGEHPMCEMHVPGICTHKATEVHHKEGRTGENYLDDTKWMAGCHNCHDWATENPKEAIELGFSLKRIT